MSERIMEQEVAELRARADSLPKGDLATKMIKEIDSLRAENSRLAKELRQAELQRNMVVDALKQSCLEGTGVQLISVERLRRLRHFNWTPEHDDWYENNQLADAALCYLKPDLATGENGPPYFWPWGRVRWKPSDRISDLVKAGALIAAEIDRLLRKAMKSSAKS